MISDKLSVARMVSICNAMGIEDIVFSPGSRNAPLTISFVESNKFNCYTIPDERVAAFFAMGLSIKKGKPTAICCTSGTAALNYAPAICEAYYQGVPMLVLTADRPAEWIDQGIGQCMRQNNVYSNYIKSSHTLIQEASEEAQLKENDNIVVQAIKETQEGFPGPVHINIPLAEPLYNTLENYTFELPNWSETDEVKTPFELEDSLLVSWKQSKRKIIILGLHAPDDELEASLNMLQERGDVVVLTETGGNCFVSDAVQTIDRFITGFGAESETYKADMVISLGGPIVSKKIKSYFLNNKPQNHWHVSLDGAKNMFKALSAYLCVKPTEFTKALIKVDSSNDEAFQNLWIGGNRALISEHERFLSQVVWSDFKAFSMLLPAIPSESVLHMGNSTVVRYIQLFEQRPELKYYGNRGVSGIDGCTSTAMGYASWSDELNVLITGDIAFYYDSNALWHGHIPKNIRIIIINNQGGGIFRIIDGPSSTRQLKTYFESYQSTNAQKLVEQYGLRYYHASDEAELNSAMELLFDADCGPAVLEIFTPREVNDKVLSAYFMSIHGG